MKKAPEIDIVTVLAMAGHLTLELQRVIDFHNQQLRVLKDQIKKLPRLSNHQRARLAAQFKQIEKRLRDEQETLVTPRTIMRWYNSLIRDKWDYSKRKKKRTGRTRTHKEKVRMVLAMAEENPGWGYRDIANRMTNLGWTICYQTVRTILLDHGKEPSKQRVSRLSWEKFHKANWNGLFALDFTTVEILTDGKLETHYLLFVIRYATRKAHFAGRTRNPNKSWVQQRLRELSNPIDGFMKDCTWIVMDNDGALHPNVVSPLTAAGIQIKRSVREAPNCNPYIERFHLSFKRDALTFIIPQSGHHIDEITNEYITYYNQERNHQGIDGALIEPQETIGSDVGAIKKRTRNGGTLCYYYRSVA